MLTDGQPDMTKLIVAFRSSANVSKIVAQELHVFNVKQKGISLEHDGGARFCTGGAESLRSNSLRELNSEYQTQFITKWLSKQRN
jgi:hypothetical protein